MFQAWWLSRIVLLQLASDAEEKNIDSDDEEEQQRRKFKAAFKQHKGMRDKKG